MEKKNREKIIEYLNVITVTTKNNGSLKFLLLGGKDLNSTQNYLNIFGKIDEQLLFKTSTYS